MPHAKLLVNHIINFFSVESHGIFSKLMALMGLTVVKFAVYSDPVFIKHKLPFIVPDSCAFRYPTKSLPSNNLQPKPQLFPPDPLCI